MLIIKSQIEKSKSYYLTFRRIFYKLSLQPERLMSIGTKYRTCILFLKDVDDILVVLVAR